MERTTWSDLTATQRRWIVVQAAVQLVLLAVAGRDLARRPAEEVRGGRKWPWALGLLVQPVGPVAYLAAGRRR